MAFDWLTENSQKFLENGYLLPGVTAQERIRQIADHAESILGVDGFGDKFYKYMSKGYYSLSSPVRSNFGLGRGFPISCFAAYLGDDMGQILFTQAEIGMMTKLGGGTGGHFSALRGRGSPIKNNGHSSGAVHFMQLFETMINVVSQGAVRRGHFSPYLPLDHPDANEFLDIGTEGNPIQTLTHAVTVKDKWMNEMIEGDEDKRKLWAKVIQRRGEMGYPYIMFEDNANNGTVDVYKDNGHTIHGSNMCSEIFLPTSTRRSFVCCLSSMNAEFYDEWKDTDAVETMIMFLDAIMSEFISKLEEMRDSDDEDKQLSFKFMERAYNFAVENRALGLGVMGYHTMLQNKMLPFESQEAHDINVQMFKLIKEKSYAASAAMAESHGAPEMLKPYGRRHATLLAVAPTTSSAFIIGQTSQSIEPRWSNYYVKDLAKIKVSIKNKSLQKLLIEKEKDTREVRSSIRDNDGSVQHLDFLSDHEKAVFKTFAEIDQFTIIDQAADRQKYIDQGQSLNVMVNPATSVKDINALYIDAWKQGIKSLYYQHSMNAAQELNRKFKCSGCEA